MYEDETSFKIERAFLVVKKKLTYSHYMLRIT